MVYHFIERNSGRVVRQIKIFQYYSVKTDLYLLEYMDTKELFLISEKHLNEYFVIQTNVLSTSEKIEIYKDLFKGREDVYAKSYINEKGKIQYFPSYHYGWRSLPPEKRTFEPLTDEIIRKHLRGEIRIGLFPITKRDTCSFLALDFDKNNFKEAVAIVRNIAQEKGCDCHVEISRSGQGAHVWFFFEEEVMCKKARSFGSALLSLAMQKSSVIDFSSFDRMFPNQDLLPKLGFGNLIALPLQGESYMTGRTVFVNEDFQPYDNQWLYLQNANRITKLQLEKVLADESNIQSDDDYLELELSNVISIQKMSISSKTIRFLKKLASFSNPEFYLKQATRQSIYQIPSRLYLFEELDDRLMLPRGLLNKIVEHFEDVTIIDRRLSSDIIKVSFIGELSFEQELALSAVLEADNGVITAATGFGKTVLSAALIGQRQQRTIILVHNRQLLEQWKERLAEFLAFDEYPSLRQTPSGKTKIIGHIGQFGANKKWRSGLVDVVMIQSLFKLPEVHELLKDYGMMIIDECHHVSAVQFEKVISKFSGKYLYGLTATPDRKNGHEPIVYQRLGDIIYNSGDRQVSFVKRLHLRFTNFGRLDEMKSKSTNFNDLNEWISNDRSRNVLICKDIVTEYQLKRKILVIVNRIDHIDKLEKELSQHIVGNIYTLSGKSKVRENKANLEKIQQLAYSAPFIIISTGKYIGEGFDLPQLDTLIIVGPLSWKNNLIQYAGRIHRPYLGKEQVKIYDYVDMSVPYLEKMYQKRQIAYKLMDYQIQVGKSVQNIFDYHNYEEQFEDDLRQLQRKIYISTNDVNMQKMMELYQILKDKSIEIEVPSNSQWSKKLQSLEWQSLAITLLHEKPTTNLMVIDEYIVWYGNFSPLGNIKNENGCLLRLESSKIAKEFLANKKYCK